VTLLNRIDGSSKIPPPQLHHHEGNSEVCVQHHGVEPTHKSGLPRGGLAIEEILPPHSHTSGGDKESRVTLDLMERLGVWCNLHGGHAHSSVAYRGERQRSVQTPPHHHHDLRCLVEAGANEVRPLLERQQRHNEAQHVEILHLKERIDRLERRLAISETARELANQHNDRYEAFLDSGAGGGPWETLRDRYDDWLMEQGEEEELDEATT
jgi:hypothetical protein